MPQREAPSAQNIEPDFRTIFEEAEVGTCFHLMRGELPDSPQPSTVIVSTYNYAKMTDFLDVFGEDHMTHGVYSYQFPQQEAKLSTPESRYRFDRGMPEFRVMRVLLAGGKFLPASVVALGNPLGRVDYWLAKDSPRT